MYRAACGWMGLILVGVAMGLTPVRTGHAAEGKNAALNDEWCGFSIAVGEPWQRGMLRAYSAPGNVRCAWAGPNNASIVIFLQEPGQAVSPRLMLDLSVKAQRESLGATVSQQEVRDVAGMQSMWMVVTGKGTGGAIDGKGDVETTQHWVAVPREKDVLIALLTSRAADYPMLQASFDAAIKSLKISGQQTAKQKAAK